MPRPYKICLMAGSMDGGGSERQTLYLLKHLDRAKFTPSLFLSYRRGDLLHEVPDDVPVHAFWDSYQPSRFRFPGQIHRAHVRAVREHLIEDAIDLLYDRTFHMSLLAAPAARGLRTRRVAAIVSPPDRDLPSTEKRFVRVKRWLLARSYKRAERVMTVSRAVADAAASYYGIDRNHFTTIHSPIDISAIEQSAGQACSVSLDPVDVNVACVGRMTAEKGHAFLLQAVADLKDHDVFDSLKVWLVGDGPLRETLQSQARTLGIDEHVVFTGHLLSAVPLLARCQLLVSASLYEGLPNVVLEAMTLGVPVVASDAGGTGELLGDDAFGQLVRPADHTALSQAIRGFVDSPEPLQEKASAAAKHVRQERCIGEVIPKIERLFLETLE